MFDEPQSGDVDIQNSDINGKGCMFINSGVTNQGIKGYTDLPARIFTANSITIDFFGNAYYRSEPYKLATHNHVFSFSGGVLSDETVGLYLVAAMSYLPKVYSYGNMATKPSLKNNHIILPSITKGKLAFDFMRRYIATLKAERVATLKAYLQAAGLSDTIMTKGELAALDALHHNRVYWKETPVCGKDGAFIVSNTHSILKAQVVPDSGKIPYVGAGESNNSIQSYISFDPSFLEKGNSIMIGGKTLVITYQEDDYISNDSHNLALYYKDVNKPTRNTQLFLVSALYKSLKPKYHWGDSISKSKIFKDSLMLPIKKDSNIDYEFIENLITAQTKLCIKDILNNKDLEISTTQNLIGDTEYSVEDNESCQQAAEPYEIYQQNTIKETILIGCYRDKKHLEWILSNHLYNIRLGGRKGSASVQPECFANAVRLYLYNLKDNSIISVYEIKENQEMSGKGLSELGYPRKSPGKQYMVFSLGNECSLSHYPLNIDRTLSSLSNHINGAPVFIEPD